MKARVYCSPWTVEFDAVSGHDEVFSTVFVWLRDNDLLGVVSTSMVYADADVDGKPDGPRVVTFVRAPDAADLGPLDNLGNTFRFPLYDLSTPMASIPNGPKNQWRNAFGREGVPTQIIDDAVTVRDVAVGLMQYINPIAGLLPPWPDSEYA